MFETLMMTCGAWSDQGPRSHNEDRVGFDLKRGILVIADGMGGHPCGDLASTEAVDAVMALLHQSPTPHEALEMAYIEAHDALSAHGDNRGTTLTIAVLVDDLLYVGHVGDTRLFVDNTQITTDQGSGQILHEFVGGGTAPEMLLYTVKISPGSHIVLTTDGVHDILDIPTLLPDVLTLCKEEPENAARVLSQCAVQLGSTDNCTALVARVESR